MTANERKSKPSATQERDTSYFFEGVSAKLEPFDLMTLTTGLGKGTDWINFRKPRTAGGSFRDLLKEKQAQANEGQTFGGTHALNPILSTKGLIFPYNPIITEGINVRYAATELTHSNESYHAYQATDNVRINISDSKWTCDTFDNAVYTLAVLHFLRSYSLMDFGRSRTGRPPSPMWFSAYGNYAFHRVPVLLEKADWTFPNDIDYVGIPEAGSFEYQNKRLRVERSPGQDSSYTWLPMVFTVSSISLIVQHAPKYWLNFNLDDYRSGKMIRTGRKSFHAITQSQISNALTSSSSENESKSTTEATPKPLENPPKPTELPESDPEFFDDTDPDNLADDPFVDEIGDELPEDDSESLFGPEGEIGDELPPEPDDPFIDEIGDELPDETPTVIEDAFGPEGEIGDELPDEPVNPNFVDDGSFTGITDDTDPNNLATAEEVSENTDRFIQNSVEKISLADENVGIQNETRIKEDRVNTLNDEFERNINRRLAIADVLDDSSIPLTDEEVDNFIEAGRDIDRRQAIIENERATLTQEIDSLQQRFASNETRFNDLTNENNVIIARQKEIEDKFNKVSHADSLVDFTTEMLQVDTVPTGVGDDTSDAPNLNRGVIIQPPKKLGPDTLSNLQDDNDSEG